MRRRLVLVLSLLALPLVLVAPTAQARDVRIELRATDEGFTLAGDQELNPPLSAEAGDVVTLVLVNDARLPHNVHVGAPVNASLACCVPPGERETFTFTVPPGQRGGMPYWSDTAPSSHRGSFFVGPPIARVRIVAPVEGADVGGNVTVSIQVQNFVLERFPAGNDPVPGRGHARYVLDGQNVSTLTDATTFTVEGVAIGHHLVRVELVGRDGAPLEPPAVHEVLVFRRADPSPVTTPPTFVPPPADDDRWIHGPAPGLALGAILLVAALTASRSRRPRG